MPYSSSDAAEGLSPKHYHALDTALTVVYAMTLAFTLVFAGLGLFAGLGQITASIFPPQVLVVLNFSIYGTLGALSFWVMRRNILMGFWSTWHNRGKALVLFLCAGVLAPLISSVLLQLLPAVAQTRSLNHQNLETLLSGLPSASGLLLVAFLGPVVEEYFFRHKLLGALSRRLPTGFCYLCSIMGFTAAHWRGEDVQHMTALIPYAVSGAVLGAVYLLSRKNIFLTLLLHAAHNTVAATIMLQPPR